MRLNKEETMFKQFVLNNVIGHNNVFSTLDETRSHAKSGDKIYLYICGGGYDIYNTDVLSVDFVEEVA